MKHYHYHIQKKLLKTLGYTFFHIALPLLPFSIINIWHPRFLPGVLLSLSLLWSYHLFPMNPGSWTVTMEYFIRSPEKIWHTWSNLRNSLKITQSICKISVYMPPASVDNRAARAEKRILNLMEKHQLHSKHKRKGPGFIILPDSCYTGHKRGFT